MQRIGVLVTDPAHGQLVQSSLRQAGYDAVVAAPDPTAIDMLLDEHDPDLVLVELGAAFYPLHYLRRRLDERGDGKPVLIVALARPEHLNPARFVAGVDDFVLCPYHVEEILARIHMALWKAKRIDARHVVSCGALSIDLACRHARVGERSLALSRREYELLAFLAGHEGRSFSRDALVQHVWGHWFEGGERVVDRYISRLRRKLGTPYGDAIETVRGIGYRLRTQSAIHNRLSQV